MDTLTINITNIVFPSFCLHRSTGNYGSDVSKSKLLDPNSLGAVQVQPVSGALLDYRGPVGEVATTDLLSSFPTALGGTVDGAPLATVGVGVGLGVGVGVGVYPTVGHEHDTAVYMMEMQGVPATLSHSHVTQTTNDPEQENNNKTVVKKGECQTEYGLSEMVANRPSHCVHTTCTPCSFRCYKKW